ncbi:MAG TPA: non-ribosomal peptide synthetase, partial [Longimicrobium sp.]|nr:non-ribosomal peptide synthetase [Longimicrobium sp.]
AFLEEPGLEACTRLRRILCSGEALPYDLQERCLARVPAELHNLYGPTEAAVDVTSWRCAPADGAGGLSPAVTVPIGRPVANTAILLLDKRGAPVPLGIPGELCIGGVQVGRGYWRRPALTAERFVPDALSHVPGARMYRTGDLARWRESAEVRGDERTPALPHSRTFVVEYLGRTDFQVKLRGFRIEPGEVESALAAHPAVREAVAAVREDAPGDPRLVAWIVPAATEAPPPAVLRAWLAERLPEHLVPSAIVALPSLPLLPNGKTDRRALPAPGAPRRDERDFVPPRTPAEVTLAGFWREVLGIERVGVEDNFFEIGGHSLLLAKVHARVRDTFSREVTMVEMFRHPTIRLLAAHLGASAAAPTMAQRGLDRAEERRASRAQPGRRGAGR